MATVVGDVQFDALLKVLYPPGLPTDMMLRGHPFMSLVPKDDNATGKFMVIPVIYDLPPGRSADIATVLGASGPIGPTSSVDFTVSLASDYAATWLNMLTVYKTANDRGAFVEARKLEIDGIITQLGNSLAHSLFRDGTGAVGQVNSAVGVPTITLKNRSDAKFFVKGGQYQLQDGTSGNPGGALRNGGAVATVAAIDEDLGNITFTGNLTAAIAAAAINDFFVAAGDSNVKVTGLGGWVPLTTPSATLFFGLDRTVHPTRLAGSRLDQPNVPAEDTIVELAEIMAERGARPDRVFVSPRQFSKIAKRLNAKVEYENAGGQADFSFSTVVIHTSAGGVKLTPDPDCPDNRGYILEMKHWRLKHLLDLPHIVMDDGIRALRRTGLDQIEIRARYYAQLVCYKPGAQGVFSCSL
jgi:hypothetical protein